MRTITHSEFQAASGEGVYVSHVHYASAAEREAGDAACQRVVVAQAFVPGADLAALVGKGRAFDPREDGQATYKGPPQVFTNDAAEEWPSDRTATEYAPPPVSASYTTQAVSGGVTMPPNCMEGGEYRAALQFESAAGDLNPDACKSGVCTTE